MAAKKRIGIVGAGVAGVAATKICLENGLEPVCFEQRSGIGGLWNRDDAEHLNIAAVPYKQMVQNGVKQFYAFSDFVPSQKYPVVLGVEDTKEYLTDYAECFKLTGSFRFNRNVVQITKSEDYEATGSYKIISVNSRTGEDETSDKFDIIICCSGFYGIQNRPSFKGQEQFAGTIVHSGSVSNVGDYTDKVVVIVGAAISGIDMLNSVAHVAKKVYLVAKHGAWILPYYPNKRQIEFTLYDPENLSSPQAFRERIQRVCCDRFDFEKTGLSPDNPLGCKPTPVGVSSDIDAQIYAGKVEVVKSEILQICDCQVKFENGRSIQADDIILATGYKPNADYIKSLHLYPDSDDLSTMRSWQFLYPMEQKHATLFTLGMNQVFAGPLPVMLETAARIICRLINGKLQLPSLAEMEEWLELTRQRQLAFSGRFPGAVSTYMRLMELSKVLGCYPDAEEIARRGQPEVADLCRRISYPFAFRLLGPDAKWHFALAALKDCERLSYANTFEEWPLKEQLAAAAQSAP